MKRLIYCLVVMCSFLTSSFAENQYKIGSFMSFSIPDPIEISKDGNYKIDGSTIKYESLKVIFKPNKTEEKRGCYVSFEVIPLEIHEFFG